MRPTFVALALTALVLAGESAKADGRLPNADERAAIEQALKAAGYTSWGKIDLDDDGYWEVEDVVGADGKRYEVELGFKDFKILKTEIDTD